jgi:hypothetical protein
LDFDFPIFKNNKFALFVTFFWSFEYCAMKGKLAAADLMNFDILFLVCAYFDGQQA